ncbi:acetate--CoA ligase family protein [uncultured Serinicoccus sp.]|uniref:acetate--CoA ligase family protein n=1 Tax=uncultured Serinicoccus sp. TaxID=735514 RepID=UPI002606C715|nr:acetate--CoA ligase family protein [uncultured Serinicoccus sp.]
MSATTMPTTAQAIQDLIHAQSVTIIGASNDGLKASGRTLRYLQKYGYTGSVYPVNPTRDTVQGLPSYSSVADLPEVPDLAVIVLPATAVNDAVRACGAHGIRTAIIFASGYAEMGADGARAQEELLSTAREAGVRLLGPNCVGAVGGPTNLTAAFMTGLDQERFSLADDGIAFVSQSGAMGAFILNTAQSTSLGVGRFLSTGNEADITISDAIEGLAEDATTTAILGYIEGIRDPESFRRALSRAQTRGVPVALMKVGRSERGAAAAQSHTGALAGQDSVYDALFRQYGVHRAESIDHLLDLGRIMASKPRPQGNRISIVTLSGGAGVLMTDVAQEVGLQVPRWNDEWAARMATELPAFAAVRNPIDTTGVVASDHTVLTRAARVCLDHPETDTVVVMLGNMEREEEAICTALAELADTSSKPIIVIWVGGSGRPQELLSGHGIPTFSEPVRALHALAAVANTRRQGAEPSREHTGDERADSVKPPNSSLQATATVAALDEVASKELLAEAGVPTVMEHEVLDAQGAQMAAKQIGYPVVVKLLSAEVAHKSDLGFVHIGLRTAEEVRAAALAIAERAERLGIQDRRIVVQQMVDVQAELILGMARDPGFGPLVLLGMGGVLTELDPDVQLRLPPLKEEDARSMIDSLRTGALLRGARGRSPVDEHALVQIVLSFSEWVEENWEEYDSIDINPLVGDAQGRLVAVDALVVPATTEAP